MKNCHGVPELECQARKTEKGEDDTREGATSVGDMMSARVISFLGGEVCIFRLLLTSGVDADSPERIVTGDLFTFGGVGE